MPSHFPNFLSSKTIEVESNDRSFFVHCDVLAAQSESFLRLTTLAPTTTVDLSNWDGDTVERLLQFLYVGDYQAPEPAPEQDEDDDDATLDGANTPDTVQSLADRGERKCKSVLLAHAKIYALAQDKRVDALRVMALERLQTGLEEIDGSLLKPTSKMSASIIELLQFVYSITTAQEPMRKVVLGFVANNAEKLMGGREMESLLSENGDFAVELMKRVAVRLCGTQMFHEPRDIVSDLERELQDWKNRATASERRVLELRATSAKMTQESKTLSEEVQRLKTANTSKAGQAEAARTMVQHLGLKVQELEAAIAIKERQITAKTWQLQQSEAENMERIRRLGAEVRQLEEKIQCLETDSVKKMEELEISNAQVRRFKDIAPWD